ncbi:MAG: hypothetical protein ATN31_04020 [Candidatus Epulonipiscioides saccharophilum]|nr:MAG: hypothetical protein ATN31_04020 [Epulopiscium sp. AS2M-Bin001]
MYPNGAKKAVTFSYDDGILQDKRLVEIFNKYSLKSTFNINSGLFGLGSIMQKYNFAIKRFSALEAKQIYAGHEVACHGVDHLHLPEISSYDQKLHEIVDDKKTLEELFECNIRGMAYAFGQVDDESINIMSQNQIAYGRVVKTTSDFSIPRNWYKWQPTTHHKNEELFDLINQFLNLKSDDLSLLYIWGHSYEFDMNNDWDRIEKCTQLLSGHNDIWYCTNIELYDFFQNQPK